jgi:hypothetical protein
MEQVFFNASLGMISNKRKNWIYHQINSPLDVGIPSKESP